MPFPPPKVRSAAGRAAPAPGDGDRAGRLGVTAEAVALTDAADVVDLHVESFIWTRVFGYDLTTRHSQGPTGGRLLSQADLPRLREAGVTAAVLSIATNPFRRAERRRATLAANLHRLQAALGPDPSVAVVDGVAAYRQARAAGRLGCFLGLQGGNALGPDDLASLPPAVCRVTLVHLTPSVLGSPSSPLEWARPARGLTPAGRTYVEALVDRRILVDLAHAGARTFWDALEVAGDQPPLVSHTGVRGVHDCWRNIDDSQIRAVADRGGVVGIMFHGAFLGGRTADAVVRHLEHVIDVGGEEAAAIGSDWDGFIVPPPELRSADRLPVLVQRMLDRGFSQERVERVLGANALRVLAAVRP